MPKLTPREFRTLLPKVMAILEESDAIVMRYFSRVSSARKPDGSEVTVADKAAERLLRSRLGAAWPADPIFGEEYGGVLARAGRCWLVDPIDGTASYVLGMPMFGTLIALAIDGQPVFGCIHLPALRETTFAATGHGCWLVRPGGRPRRVHVAKARALGDAKVGMTSSRSAAGSNSAVPARWPNWGSRSAACGWWVIASSTPWCAGACWTRRSTR